MSRNLLLLNALLLALCGVATWRLMTLRSERLSEQAQFLRRMEAPPAPPAVLMPRPAPPAQSNAYLEVAQKLLLSADRNPTVILDIVPPKVMPPLPRAYGAMDFGGGPRVFMAAKPGDRQRPYAPGEQIGEFKLLTISRAGVVFEWDGKEVAASFDQMKDTANVQARAAQAAAPPPPSAPARAKLIGGTIEQAAPTAGLQTIAPTAATPGRPMPGNGPIRDCAPGDNAPSGTTSEGYRKVTISTPMGNGCSWRRVQ